MLPWHERWLLLRAAMLLPLTAVAVRVLPLPFLQRLTSPSTASRMSDHERADRTAHMVAAAAEYGLYRASCLPQSLVLQYFLSRAGIRSELRFGVNKSDGAVRAHCWIEVNGAPLIDSSDVHRHYAALEAPARWPR